MNARARARVHAMLPILDDPTEADARAAELDARLDAVRVEDLNEALTVLRGWQGEISELRAPGLEFAIGVLLSVRDDRDPNTAAPAGADLHDTVFRAVGTAKGPLMPLPVKVQRLLAEHVTNAVAPLVPYREVWDSSFPPGGRVCNICGQPVESEPCPDHAPAFFQTGRAYRHTQTGSTIRVLAIDPHPVTGVIHAIGWLHNPASSPLVGRLNGLDWESGDWTDATEAREKSSPTRADATPDFYQPGYVYSYPRYADGYDWKFRVDTITTHPETGERIALGWRSFKGEWGECAYGEDDWDIHNCDPAGDLIATPVEEVAR